MPQAIIKTAIIFEDSAAVFLARIQDENGVNFLQAAVASITYKVTRISDGTETASGSVTVATSVFDVLQTGPVWVADSSGYNFKHTVAGTAFPDGATDYQVEYLITPVAGNPFTAAVYKVTTRNVFSS